MEHGVGAGQCRGHGRGLGDVADPRLHAVAPGGRQAFEDEVAGSRRAHEGDDAVAGVEEGRQGPAPDESRGTRDEDGGHDRGIVASADDEPLRGRSSATHRRTAPAPGRGDAEGGTPPPPRRLAPGRDRARARPHARDRCPDDVGRHVGRAHRTDAVPRPGRAAARVRPADRPDAGRRGARADHGRARRDEGRRQRPLRRDPLGPAPARRARAVAGRRHRRGLCRGLGRGGPHGDRRSGSSARRFARTTRPRTSSSPRPRSASATTG